MISLWVMFFVGHELGFVMGSFDQWWNFPFFLSTAIACTAELVFYAYQFAKRMP